MSVYCVRANRLINECTEWTDNTNSLHFTHYLSHDLWWWWELNLEMSMGDRYSRNKKQLDRVCTSTFAIVLRIKNDEEETWKSVSWILQPELAGWVQLDEWIVKNSFAHENAQQKDAFNGTFLQLVKRGGNYSIIKKDFLHLRMLPSSWVLWALLSSYTVHSLLLSRSSSTVGRELDGSEGGSLSRLRREEGQKRAEIADWLWSIELAPDYPILVDAMEGSSFTLRRAGN